MCFHQKIQSELQCYFLHPTSPYLFAILSCLIFAALGSVSFVLLLICVLAFPSLRLVFIYDSFDWFVFRISSVGVRGEGDPRQLC